MESDGGGSSGRYEFNMPLLFVVAAAFFAGAILMYFFFTVFPADSSILNPSVLPENKFQYFSKMVNCTSRIGEVYTVPGRGLTLYVYNNRIIGVSTSWPASLGWHPWAKENNGEPSNITRVPTYSHGIFFVERSTVVC